MLAVSGVRLSLLSMPRMTLVEMLLSSATRMRKSLGSCAGSGCVLYIRLLLVTPCLRWLSSSARVVFSV